MGVLLSMIPPTGLLLVRELYTPLPLMIELASDRLAYVYVLILTALLLGSVDIVGRQAEPLVALSETDALTGLPNRRALERHLDKEYRRSLRYQTPISLPCSTSTVSSGSMIQRTMTLETY
jgi:GGDEF domain-containing protein